MNAHKQMWNELHHLIHKLTVKGTRSIPDYAAHEIQGMMNEIEMKYTGDVEFRAVEGDMTGKKHEFKNPYE